MQYLNLPLLTTSSYLKVLKWVPTQWNSPRWILKSQYILVKDKEGETIYNHQLTMSQKHPKQRKKCTTLKQSIIIIKGQLMCNQTFVNGYFQVRKMFCLLIISHAIDVSSLCNIKHIIASIQSNGQCTRKVKERVPAGWSRWRRLSAVTGDRRKASSKIKDALIFSGTDQKEGYRGWVV